MSDLAAWLTQIWDEQEATARAVAVEGRPLEGGSGSWFESDRAIGDKTGYVVAYGVEWDAARKRIVNHDPASALARIAADRQILEVATKAIADAPERGYDWESEWARAKAVAYENVVRLKAAAYADRPGYQEAWRPE